MSSGSQRSRKNSSSSRGTWWEVEEIIDEDAGKRFRVRWAGKDPKTGKPWPLDWVPNSHCSSDLIKDWEKKKAKKQESLPSGSISTSRMTSVAFKRPPGKRNVTATSEVIARRTRKRKHPTPPGSPGNTDENSAPSRKRLATAVPSTPDGVGQSTAPPNREDPEVLPSHPPLDEIEEFVPNPNAKFGPPKRRRTTGGRPDPPKEGPLDIADSAKTPVPTPIPPPSSSRPLILSDSQIIALREEEEESQSQLQSASNQPVGPVEDSTTSDPLQPTIRDAKGATQVSKDNSLGSLEGPIERPSADIQVTNPNVDNGHVSGPNSQAVVPLQSNDTNTSRPGEGVTEAPKGLSPLPTAPHISLVNLSPSSSTISPSKSSQIEKPPKFGPPRIRKPDASPITQHGPSRREPPRSSGGTLAERRAFEARVRLAELRRAGANFGNLLKGHTALMTPQSSKQPSPHVVLKQFVDGVESPSQSQNTHPGKPGNEILGNASPSENRRAEPLGESEDQVINEVGQDATVGSLPRKDDALAPNVVVLGSEDEVPPTASNSTQSQSNDALLNTSLGSQLAAALELLHKKSEEISELRAQVVASRMRSTGGEESLMHKQTGNGALHDREGAGYLATGVQTDRDDEAHTAWNSERTQWAEEKLALQREAEALRGEKARALADVDFFREQYQRASAFASTTRSENEELSARATLVESQVVNGVALVRATFEARVTKLEAEARKYKALSEMLTERARRTDDNVRYQASRAFEMDVELRNLRGEYREMEAELEETIDELRAKKRANARLRRLVASLESREQAADEGTPTGQEPTFRSDEKADEDYRPPSSSPRGGSDRSPPRRHSPRDDDDAGPTDGEIEELVYLGESVQSSIDDMAYLCRWRSGEPAGCCDAVVNTKKELHEHVLSHHLACHPNPPRS